MKPSSAETRTLGEQTLQWIRCLPQATHEEREAFALWLKQSPLHVGSYLQMLAVEREFDGFDAAREIDVEELIARAQNNVVPFGLYRPFAALRAGSRVPRRAVLRWLAASVAVLALGGVLFYVAGWGRDGLQEYATRTGEQQQLKLSDGSIVNLNAETTVRIAVTPQRRDVYLVSGEALFDVQHDVGRPFRVHVDGVTIEDVGTQFNVYKRTEAMKISVIEGEVKVFQEARAPAKSLLAPLFDRGAQRAQGDGAPIRTTPVSAGRTISLSAKGRSIEETELDLQRTIAWRQRMLIFHGNSLREIAAEFNRYNVQPKIRIDDERTGARTFSGIFRADDPKSFITFLQQETDLAVGMDGGNLVIASR